MTPKQRATLDFIAAFWAENGYAPSYQEAGDSLGCVKSAIHARIRSLELRGLVTRSDGVARCVELTDKGAALCG